MLIERDAEMLLTDSSGWITQIDIAGLRIRSKDEALPNILWSPVERQPELIGIVCLARTRCLSTFIMHIGFELLRGPRQWSVPHCVLRQVKRRVRCCISALYPQNEVGNLHGWLSDGSAEMSSRLLPLRFCSLILEWGSRTVCRQQQQRVVCIVVMQSSQDETVER